MLLVCPQLLARLMSNLFLHREVREKGGAYGAGARAGHNSFDMTSYRDPHANQTLQSFADAARWAADIQNYSDAVRGSWFANVAV